MMAQAGRLVLALEHAWLAIRRHQEEVPAAVLILAGHAQGRRLPLHEHWATSSWAAKGTSEVVIGSGLLVPGCSGVVYEKDPGERMLAALLHEASHGLAFARGVRDSSKDGRYHNARFCAIALQVGLDVGKGTPYGFSHTRLNNSLRAVYRLEIDALRRAAAGYGCPAPRRPSLAKPKRPLYVCACDPARKLRMSPSTFQAAPVVCGACGCGFREAHPPTCPASGIPAKG